MVGQPAVPAEAAGAAVPVQHMVLSSELAQPADKLPLPLSLQDEQDSAEGCAMACKSDIQCNTQRLAR